MKRILICLLCLLIFTGSAGAEVYWPSPDSYVVAQEGAGASCGDNLTWTMEGNTLYITGSGEMYDFYSGAPWASYKTSITRVVLSDGITYVGACAFQDYDALLGVEFGNFCHLTRHLQKIRGEQLPLLLQSEGDPLQRRLSKV